MYPQKRAPRSARPPFGSTARRLSGEGAGVTGRSGSEARKRAISSTSEWPSRRNSSGASSSGAQRSCGVGSRSSHSAALRRRLLAAKTLRNAAQPDSHDHEQRGHHGRAHRHELQDALLDGDSHDVRNDHWKISVVQSPPWRRTSWARAGPSGRSWKSTKKSGSISIPPSGPQFTFSSHERSSG